MLLFNLNDMKNSIFSILLIFSGILLSCSKELDVPPEGQLPEGYVQPVNPDQAFAYVSACYAGLRGWSVSTWPFIGMFEVSSDDADKGSTRDDNPGMIEMDTYTVTPANDQVIGFWTDNYTLISHCNYAINYISGLQFKDTATQKQLIAEARFLRGFLYYRLNLVYGGVPLIDTIQSASQAAKIQRSSVQDVYRFVEADLNYAIIHLPVSYSFQWFGRATQGAAKSLLARVYMYEGNWAGVKTLTDQVIASGLYALYPNFYKLFRVEGENNSESIFELQNTSMDQGRYRCEYGFVQGPRNNFARLQGWGFCVPSAALIAFFDSRHDSIRKFATILPRGFRTPEGDSIDILCANPYYNFKVYEQLKYNIVDYALDHNIRYIRYAEVLLMNAEAALNVGGDAATPLNEVRKRAGLSPIAAPTMQDVWDERRAELALEEFRFFDLVRTGRAPEILGPLGFKTGKNERFPIPQTQIDLSNGVLTQNPGY
jgi:hypothetical protein